ncbi:MAG: tetratricopeptide repeat protein [Steroidobacteraceae bacterium]
MKMLTPLLMALSASALATPAAAPAAPPAGERLGDVSFSVSCSPSVRAPFSRGVALLHDFWYDEARPQFERIAKADPGCAMAHWGIAMSVFHQIWGRPDADAMTLGRKELQVARTHPAKTAREREYIAALGGFYEPDQSDYQARVDRYSAAMAQLYARYPEDTDAGAFYALSLLAAEDPNDTSLAQEHRALAVLNPLFAKHPDHPGVVHYIIHACDTPSLAKDGLAAARHYGEIAPSGPHAVHMPGHIFARLGMWQADIDSNRGSVAASQAAEARGESGAMDQFHSDDFLLYAYLQSAQDAAAKAVMADAAAAIAHFETMPNMADHYMVGMFPYYRAKLPIIFDLEMRDWKSAAALEPVPGAPPQTQTMTYWARAIAAGHLHDAKQARAALAEYDSLHEQMRKGPHAYVADSTGTRIARGEMLAWAEFAEDNAGDALKSLRDSADLQDRVGQGEVDIPAREMLADMLMELGKPREALAEYHEALQLSPNRFNGLYNAGRAAEALGETATARGYYLALLGSTDNGAHSSRPELDHVKAFATSTALAAK